MPIYEYVCPKCGFEKEVFFRKIPLDETELSMVYSSQVEGCGESCKLERKVSIPNYRLLGPGFYKNDSKE